MIVTKNKDIGMTLQLIKSDGISPEENATITYKIFDPTGTVEVVSEQNTSYNINTQSYIDTLVISGSWTSQEIGSYLIVWAVSDTEDDFPGVLTEDLQINMDETKIDKILGLVHQNIYIDEAGYDLYGNLSSARIRIYSDSSAVGTTSNIISTYRITSINTEMGKFTTWKQIEE
jgi:hypothetical protein